MVIVVAGVAVRDCRLLLAQRSAARDYAGLWETPGGKVEHGEDFRVALVRELVEELGVEARVADGDALSGVDVLNGDGVRVCILHYAVELIGEPQPIVATALRWVSWKEMTALPLTPGTEAAREVLQMHTVGARHAPLRFITPQPFRAPTQRCGLCDHFYDEHRAGDHTDGTACLHEVAGIRNCGCTRYVSLSDIAPR